MPTSPDRGPINRHMKRVSSFFKKVMEEKARPHREASVNPTALAITDAYECFQLAKPKVLVLFCGGTLIMRENEDGSLVVNDKDVAIDLLLNMEPRIHDFADIDVHYIDNIDSSNMCPKLWDAIGGVINEKYNDYEGYVVTHGTGEQDSKIHCDGLRGVVQSG